MKQFIIALICFLTLSSFSIQQKEHPTLTKMKANYYLYLDNGFEQIDLYKTIEAKKSFFKLGTPRLVLAPKIGPFARKNVIVGFSLLLTNSNPMAASEKTKNTFSISGNFFNKEACTAIGKLASESVLTFTEINLTTTDLDGPNLKGVRPKKIGQLPIGFTVYVLD